MMGQGRTRLQELDALRGIAAFSVLLFHYFNIYPKLFPHGHRLPPLFEHGGYGVLLFFAISGFVIAFSLEGTRSAADFAVKRFARLFPVYWAAMALSIGIVLLLGAGQLLPPAWVIPVNMTMLQGYFYLPAVDGVYWTLGVELAFYCCMLAIWMGRGFARLEWLLLGWLAIKAAIAGWHAMPSRLVMLLVLDYIPFFIIGMLFYRIWSGHRRWGQQALFFVAALATIAWADPREYLVAALLVMAIFAAMLRGWLPFLRHRLLLWLGAISYALYLIHHNAGLAIMNLVDRAGLSTWIGLLLATAASLLLASALTYGVERPAARRINRWWRERTASQGQRATQAG
ncbi:acyltransferase [Sphingobium yanoikuyae]|uniref:Acyltransferase n=1 Tax=Sphingobium yanoikuyae TaxID=13690 RepID=A0A177JS13_SPHYA|nr:acyltransferase [Sphingobium yanoikuyae]OAH43943.1 acyltransferase [Sphingobium yanoikuyae]PZU62651.1 MAG: acyltransferase [Sphingobium sp.]